jgi:hypothetical protein
VVAVQMLVVETPVGRVVVLDALAVILLVEEHQAKETVVAIALILRYTVMVVIQTVAVAG